jgi:hypothetical protein
MSDLALWLDLGFDRLAADLSQLVGHFSLLFTRGSNLNFGRHYRIVFLDGWLRVDIKRIILGPTILRIIVPMQLLEVASALKVPMLLILRPDDIHWIVDLETVLFLLNTLLEEFRLRLVGVDFLIFRFGVWRSSVVDCVCELVARLLSLFS